MFKSHQDLIDWVKTTGRCLGYAIITRRSKKDASGVLAKVILMCNRGGIYKNKKSTSNRTSKKINCPFQLVGKYSKMYDSWMLRIKCEKHNHEPTLDMEGHPHADVIADADVTAVPAEDEPTFGRPFQPHRDLVLNKLQGPFLMSDSLVNCPTFHDLCFSMQIVIDLNIMLFTCREQSGSVGNMSK